MTKNRCSISMVVSYTIGMAMERRFQEVKKNLPAPFASCSAQKVAPVPKTTNKGPHFFLVTLFRVGGFFSVAYLTVANLARLWSCHTLLESPQKGDFRKSKNFLPASPTFCPTQKVVLGPKLSTNGCTFSTKAHQ